MPQYDAREIVKNIEEMIDEEGEKKQSLPSRVERGSYRDGDPAELRQAIDKILEKNALKEMKEIKNIDKVISGSRFGFVKKIINRVYRFFTGPQAAYNNLNLEALNIIAYNLEMMREHLLRMEEKDNRNFGATGETASDMKRLSVMVSDHLSQIYSNANTIHRDIASVTDSLSHVLDHLRSIGEQMGSLSVSQSDVRGEMSAARMDMSSLWTELDLVYDSLDNRTKDIWDGLGERDELISKNTEAAHNVANLSREIKARLLVISEQISLHQELLETLQTRVGGTPLRPEQIAMEQQPVEQRSAETGEEPLSRPIPPMPAQESVSNTMLQQLMGMAYSRFQRQYRGDDEELRRRQQPYVKLLEKYHGEDPLSSTDPLVLDIACGDGIFLHALREMDWQCLGVDMNRTMVNHGQGQGLPIEHGEAIQFLQNVEEKSFTAITAFQFVEHLDSETLMRLLRGAYRALRPGGLLLIETINPHSLVSLRWFHMDLTHQHLIYPEVLQVLSETAGFQFLDWKGINPVENKTKLTVEGEGLEAENAKKLNELLFGPQDYYFLARKPMGSVGKDEG